jgi:SM-20-related protein
MPDLIPPLLVDELRVEAEQIWETGGFRHAGVGRGAARQIRPEVRTDRVSWLDPAAGGAARRLYLQALEALRHATKRERCLGLFDFEGHLALYRRAATTASILTSSTTPGGPP